MRLGNILLQQGGVPETGRRVKFQVRQVEKGGKVRKWCEAMILPVSEDERSRVRMEAKQYCDEHPEASLDAELLARMIQAMLYDPDDLRCKFITADEISAIRAGVVADQTAWLLSEYRLHIESEYPELITKPEGEELEKEAEGNS